MSKEDNGGPAFPLPLGTANCAEPNESGGMTLRDYFAAHADIGNVDELSMISGQRILNSVRPEWRDDPAACFAWWADYRAKLRYIEADAMLKARKS